MIPLQFLCFEAVDGEHIHLGEACGPEGSSCFVKVEGQAGRVVGIGVMMTLPPIFCHSPSSQAPG